MSDLIDMKNALAEKDLARFVARHPSSPVVQTRLVENLTKAKQAVKQASHELKLLNPPEHTRLEMYSKILESAKADMKEHMIAERDAWSQKLNKEAEAWQRERRLNSNRYQAENAQQAMRFEAMTPDEVKLAAAEYMTRPKPTDPFILDSLSIQLKKADPEQHAEFRTFIKDSKAYEPWRYTDEGKRIGKYLDALDHGINGQGDDMPMVHEDGVIHFESLSAILGGTV